MHIEGIVGNLLCIFLFLGHVSLFLTGDGEEKQRVQIVLLSGFQNGGKIGLFSQQRAFGLEPVLQFHRVHLMIGVLVGQRKVGDGRQGGGIKRCGRERGVQACLGVNDRFNGGACGPQ
ncbi:hypothetical protein D3C76_1443670 [compost metagenome]